MEYSFSREELINAIEYLDQHPEEFKGRESSTYDLVYDDKKYPPILVLSKANELKGDNELLLKDFKNSTKNAFKYLKVNGFMIVEKDSVTEFSPFLKDFLNQSQTTDLKSKKYSVNFQGTKVKASFGQGGVANVSWISFLKEPNTTSQGIYPVYLYFKSEKLLILAYGISETTPPENDWDSDLKIQTINDFYQKNNLGIPYRYGGSYVYKTYSVENLPSDEKLDQDLINIINIYKKNINSLPKKKEIKEIKSIDLKIDSFLDSLRISNLQFNDNLVQRFVASLLTKPFVILTGLAGSGKTKLAQSFIQWICESKEQYKLVAVGADWINREPLLGYPNGLNSKDYVTPDNGVLELMLTASKIENQDKPYFLVLDEMNLSHVERYFADFLSIMESEDSIKLYTGAERKSTNDTEIPQTISWPKNLFIIGTVNIDETTYMFSPKVLDRANVIEFKLDEDDLKSFLAEPKKVDLSQLTSEGAAMASSFITLSKQNDTASNEVLNETLVEFFKELKMIGAEFGYRTAFEIHLLFAQFSKIDSSLSDEDKIDFAVMQKLLPKLHGSRSKIVKSLEALIRLCLEDVTEFNLSKLDDLEENQIKYNVSFDKLKRMYANALSNGFTSYAEA